VGSIPITRSNYTGRNQLKRILKILGITLGLVVFLAVALAIVLPFLIDPNDYKPEIIRVVKDQTGRELTLEGDIGLSVFPWIGLELGKTQLSNAPGFGTQPFLRVDQAAVRVELLPLLRKQVLVDKVVLDGLQVNLARDRKGRTNWDDLVEAMRAPAKKKPAKPEAERPRAAFGFGVAGLDVQRGEIHWRDAMTGSDYHVRQLTVRTGNVVAAEPVDIHLSFDMESGKPVIKTRVALNGDVLFDPGTQGLKSRKMTLEAAGLKLSASIDGKQVMQKPSFSGTLQLADFNVRKFLKDLNLPPIETADAAVLTRASMQTAFRASTTEVALDKLRLSLDDSAITGSASARFASLPAIRFDLTLNDIDVDRYLPPAAPKTKAKKPVKAAALPIPLKLLRKLDVRGKFAVQKMKAFGIRSSAIAIPVSARGGQINIGPNSAKLYQGSYSGFMSMDVRKASPRYSVNEKLTNVQIGPFLRDTEIFDKFDGQGNVSARLTARGLDVDDILNTVNGKASVSLKNGSLSGINIYEFINDKCRALQQPGAAPAPQDSKNKSTPFADLNASASIVNGMVSNQDLSMKGKLLRVSGKGKVNLPKKHVDYLAQINLLGETTCWTTEFAVLVKGRFDELSAGKIIGDTQAPGHLVSRFDAENLSTPTACLVRPTRSQGPAMATPAKPLPYLGVRDHAAADAGLNCHSVL
jgi:AsmA protein